MPGGQYTNLYQQAQALNLENRWSEVCRVYADVNRLFGDIVKVTPTSKVVGDMALFMVANNLTPKDSSGRRARVVLPRIGRGILRRQARPTGRRLSQGVAKARAQGPQTAQGPAGRDAAARRFRCRRRDADKKRSASRPRRRDVVTHLLYPRVADDFHKHQLKYSDTSVLPTNVFFYGMEPGEEVSVDIEEGKTLIIKFLTIGDPHRDGRRLVFFELNGQPREVLVVDNSLINLVRTHPKAEAGNPLQIAAPMPGLVVRVNVAPGEQVAKAISSRHSKR